MVRRDRLIWLSSEELAELMFGGVARVTYQSGESFPPGMEVVHATWSPERGQLAITVRHDSFDEVPVGNRISSLFTRIQE